MTIGVLLTVVMEDGKGSLARPRQAVVVTRDDPGLPDRCRPQPLADVVLDFFEALAKGNRAKLGRLFGPDFKWFSVTGSPAKGHKRHFVAYRADKAIEYIAERRGFNLLLSDLVVDDAPSRHSDIFYSGVWKENGARWRMDGKGAINCRKRTVKVWSMSSRKERVDRGAALCPPPASEPTRNTVIACVREE